MTSNRLGSVAILVLLATGIISDAILILLKASMANVSRETPDFDKNTEFSCRIEVLSVGV